ncbi:MAG: hypothetical protein AAF702_16520 [Chloroflexota bacterium]
MSNSQHITSGIMPYADELVGGYGLPGVHHQADGSQDAIWPANIPHFHLHRNERHLNHTNPVNHQDEQNKPNDGISSLNVPLALAGRLYAFADGVSLCADGQKASQMAVRAVATSYYESLNPSAVVMDSDENREKYFQAALMHAHHQLSHWDQRLICRQCDATEDGWMSNPSRNHGAHHKTVGKPGISLCSECHWPMVGLQASIAALLIHGEQLILKSVGSSWILRIPGDSSKFPSAQVLSEPQPGHFLGVHGLNGPPVQTIVLKGSPDDTFVLCCQGLIDILHFKYGARWPTVLAHKLRGDNFAHTTQRLVHELDVYRNQLDGRGHKHGIGSDLGLIAVGIPDQGEIEQKSIAAQQGFRNYESLSGLAARQKQAVLRSLDAVESYLLHQDDRMARQQYIDILIKESILPSEPMMSSRQGTEPFDRTLSNKNRAYETNANQLTQPAWPNPVNNPARYTEPKGDLLDVKSTKKGTDIELNKETNSEASNQVFVEPQRIHMQPPTTDCLMDGAEQSLLAGNHLEAGGDLDRLWDTYDEYAKGPRAQRLRAWQVTLAILDEMQQHRLDEAIRLVDKWLKELLCLECPSVEQIQTTLLCLQQIAAQPNPSSDGNGPLDKLRMLFVPPLAVDKSDSLEVLIQRSVKALEVPLGQAPRFRVIPNSFESATEPGQQEQEIARAVTQPAQEQKKSSQPDSEPQNGNRLDRFANHLNTTSIALTEQSQTILNLKSKAIRTELLDALTHTLIEVERAALAKQWKLVFMQLPHPEVYASESLLHDLVADLLQIYFQRWLDHLLTIDFILIEPDSETWVPQRCYEYLKTVSNGSSNKTNRKGIAGNELKFALEIQQLHSDAITHAQPQCDMVQISGPNFASPFYLVTVAVELLTLRIPETWRNTERAEQLEQLQHAYLNLAYQEMIANQSKQEWSQSLQDAMTAVGQALLNKVNPTLVLPLKQILQFLQLIELSHAISLIDRYFNYTDESPDEVGFLEVQQRLHYHKHSRETVAQAIVSVLKAGLTLQRGFFRRDYARAIVYLMQALTSLNLPKELYSQLARRVVELIGCWHDDPNSNLLDWLFNRENRIGNINHQLACYLEADKFPSTVADILIKANLPETDGSWSVRKVIWTPAYVIGFLSLLIMILLIVYSSGSNLSDVVEPAGERIMWNSGIVNSVRASFYVLQVKSTIRTNQTITNGVDFKYANGKKTRPSSSIVLSVQKKKKSYTTNGNPDKTHKLNPSIRVIYTPQQRWQARLIGSGFPAGSQMSEIFFVADEAEFRH